jgi:nucleotide-binding universal stress UspA family protein
MAQRFLVATDFSTRSDRALRRASLLARQVSAELILVHVVDDDRPKRLIQAERLEAEALLAELAATLREADGIACDSRVVFGAAFQALSDAAGDTGADLLVIGPHRRQMLRDTFLGTTAERTIRASGKPVLMANSVPAGPYRTVVLATDFSPASVAAAQAAKQLGLLGSATVVALHMLDLPEEGPVLRATMAVTEYETFLAQAEQRAHAKLERYGRETGIAAVAQVLRPAEEPTGMAVNGFAKSVNAGLVVAGTHGRTGLEKWLLGSVAESILSHAEMDVLAVPPSNA